MFYVGQKVVCVDAKHTRVSGIQELEEGRVYEIEWIGYWDAPHWSKELCVRLVGVRRALDSPLTRLACFASAPSSKRKQTFPSSRKSSTAKVSPIKYQKRLGDDTQET